MANAVVRARIDERVKREAADVLAEIGLSVSDAFRLMMVRIARDKALPFDLNAPDGRARPAAASKRQGKAAAE
jgi:DNA-damage-inducible protein J